MFKKQYNQPISKSTKKLVRYNEAMEVFKKAIQIDPVHAETYSNLGCAYVELLRYEEAIEVCK